MNGKYDGIIGINLLKQLKGKVNVPKGVLKTPPAIFPMLYENKNPKCNYSVIIRTSTQKPVNQNKENSQLNNSVGKWYM